MRVRAPVLHEPGAPVVVEEVELAAPQAHEVLVRVAAVGEGVTMLMDGTSRLSRPDGTTLQHGLMTACFAGRTVVARLPWDVIRGGATAVVVGLAPKGVEVSLPAIEFLSDKGIRGSCYGSGDPAADLPALAALDLHPDEVVST